MGKIKLYKKRVLWIFILNIILILTPISGFYSIYIGNYEALRQRRMNLLNLNNIITNRFDSIMIEELARELPVFAPFQRIIILQTDNIIDSGWLVNQDYFRLDNFSALLGKLFLKPISPPVLNSREIIDLLQNYLAEDESRLGIMDYRFIYSLQTGYDENKMPYKSIVIVDKSDIMLMAKIKKIFLFLISAVSFLITLIVSGIYYFLFVKPLFCLTEDALDLQKNTKITDDCFNMRNRNDEIGQLSRAFYFSAIEIINKRRQLETFTADILHELRNPLATLRNGIEILGNHGIIKNQKDLNKLLQTMAEESGRMEKLLFEIRELSFYENQTINEEFCQPHKIIPEICSLYKHRQIKISIKAASEHQILLPADKFVRVLKNLLDNAVDFSPMIAAVSVNYQQDKQGGILIVADQGEGISNAEKSKIFDRFYSSRSASEAKNLHSGLGLSIVKNILQTYNYSISCYDNQPTGACFEIRFFNE